jgi:transposase
VFRVHAYVPSGGNSRRTYARRGRSPVEPGNSGSEELKRPGFRRGLTAVRRCDRDLVELEARIRTAVAASGSSVTSVHGVGPIMAAYLIGYTGNIARFPSAGHYARYNGTAPIDASSGTHIRHRLNPGGNRQLNGTAAWFGDT